jgi:hypothetical protein
VIRDVAQAGVDTLAADWDFGAVARESVVELRRRYGVPPLPSAEDATLVLACD